MMFDNGAHSADPYADAPYNPPPPVRPESRNGDSMPSRGRSRSRSPVPRNRSPRRYSPPPRKRSPPPRPRGTPSAKPSAVVGVFGLSIRTQERDLDEEFSRYGRVEKVTIVYDQRTDRSRGFGFVRMSSVDEAAQCVQELNGLELNGRRIRVDYSTTEKPHAPTPGEYMGYRRSEHDDKRRSERSSHYDGYGRDRDYGRDSRDSWRDRDYGRREYRDRDYRDRRSPRRSPSPPRRRRSYSRSPPRGSGSSPSRREDAPPASRDLADNGRRW
ncbi:hypothetical protein FS749_000571 [Ceratobasidium sp. UAMH 11750]|nr:hypothetical protein FS749_000571 [Ceratobasidium sp. UAMH 11750]